MKEIDVLVVGGGISGHVITHLLLQKGKSVELMDQPQKNTSSRVAAGLFNPIVLKRLNLAWRAEETINAATPFYKELERQFQQAFFYKRPLVRIYADYEEANNWFVKAEQENYTRFLNPDPEIDLPSTITAPFGVGLVKESGYMDMTFFFTASEKALKQKAVIHYEQFDHRFLIQKEKGVEYRGQHYNAVVFCEGTHVEKNPLFQYLPIEPNKGDIITLESPASSIDERYIFSKSMFLIPLGNGLFRAGSTYQRKWTVDGPDASKKEEILERIEVFYQDEKQVVQQDWGLRPTVTDRRPILGQHPVHKNCFILNGMGSRGVLMAPLLAEFLLDHIYEQKKLPEEVSVSRFEKFFNI